jgi:hypothetical protein
MDPPLRALEIPADRLPHCAVEIVDYRTALFSLEKEKGYSLISRAGAVSDMTFEFSLVHELGRLRLRPPNPGPITANI